MKKKLLKGDSMPQNTAVLCAGVRCAFPLAVCSLSLPPPFPLCPYTYSVRYRSSSLGIDQIRNNLELSSLRSHTHILMHAPKRSIIANKYQPTGRQSCRQPPIRRREERVGREVWRADETLTARPNAD